MIPVTFCLSPVFGRDEFMIKKLMLTFLGASALTACSLDPKDHETAPVTLDTAAGPVVCQLYRKDMVRWDRSISRPESMSVETADALCLEEGKAQKNS